MAAAASCQHHGRALAVATVVAYNSWVAWPLNGNPDALRGYLSELAARDQPFHWFFQLGDLLSALLFLAIAYRGQRHWRSWLGTYARWTALSLKVVGVATALDVAVALPCAESTDPVCAATPSLVRHLHAATSVAVSLGFIGTFVGVMYALRRLYGWTYQVQAMGATALIVAGLMLTSAVGPWIAPGSQGVLQASQVSMCSLWVALLAWRLDDGTCDTALGYQRPRHRLSPRRLSSWL